MINLLADEMRNDPYPILASLRKNNPLCQAEPAGIWVLTRYEDVVFGSKRHDLFSSIAAKSIMAPEWLSPDCRRGFFIISEDPPAHSKHRGLINKTFISQIINDLAPMMEKTAHELINKMRKKNTAEFMEDFSYPYTSKIINAIVGVESEQKIDDVRSWIDVISMLTIQRPHESQVESIESAIRDQIVRFKQIIQSRRVDPREDFVTALARITAEDDNLTDDMLVNALDILISAGYMTTVHVLGVTLLQLAKQPELAELLRKDTSQIPNFIEEILRLYSPSLCIIRETTQPVSMHGLTIPAYQRVLLYLASANRDESKFTHPDEIDLYRENIKDHLSFGIGPHVCIGLALAKLEIRVFIEAILQHTNEIICPDTAELDWAYSVFMRGLNSLPIKLK